ncbi:type I methionyl aminopeptidase [Nocardia sp. NPDC004722]
MVFGRRKMKVVPFRTRGELDAMAAAGVVVGRTLGVVGAAVRPGVSTLELARIAEQVIRESGAIPAFQGFSGFSESICVSVNDAAVNGLPTAEEVLAAGDLVSVNCGVVLEGWCNVAACTFGVGQLSKEDHRLIEATRIALDSGIGAMLPDGTLTDVSTAIAAGVRDAERKHDRAYGIVEGYGGHGIGRQLHMDPFVANEPTPGRGPRLAIGSVLAIQPVLTLGGSETRTRDDEWTQETADGSRSALWEQTVAVTEDGPRILTPWPY